MIKKVLPITALLSFVVVLIILVYSPLTGSDNTLREFVIQKGDGSAKVARLLSEQRLVKNRYLFIGYTLLIGKEKSFRAGRYLISPAMSIPKIVGIFTRGKAEPEGVLITIPEGLNAWEIVKLLESDGKFKELNTSEFLDNEGYLFPDTYFFGDQEVNDKEQTKEIIGKMKENFESKLKDLESEIIIIASMLEKEVQAEKDMRLVAGIIYKRLELDMPLQLDATVAYGACLKISKCDVSRINLAESIKIDSPYNTYARKGLPVGPISNPGLKAIEAALNPEVSDYLYYLSASDDNRTIFSKTAEEHSRNRAKYLK
ncbi:MAG: endolytic transglycosylase MltG [Patescibacteria group bacterium]